MAIEIVHKPAHVPFNEFYRVEMECFPDEPITAPTFSEMTKNEFWAAMSGTRFVGYGYLKVTPEYAWIARVGVAASERNKGIGARLMEAMVARCLEIRKKTVILYVQQDNAGAIELYRKFNFSISEESYQYIVPTDWITERLKHRSLNPLSTVGITDVPPDRRPVFPDQWAHLPELHDPPKTRVLIFRYIEAEPIGYCRLSPDFPGCFPIDLTSPSVMLSDALTGLHPYLLNTKRILKLTFDDPEMARICTEYGFTLNYRLYMMKTELK